MSTIFLPIFLFSFVTFCYSADTFQARNGRLYDANGVEFLMRGVNSAHAWWDNYNRNYALDSIPYIAQTGSNTVRIAWMHTLNNIDHSYLEKIIQACIAYKMVPVVELHDATCKQDPNELIKTANWFVQNMWLFNKYKKYIIINIANEWSPTTHEIWRDTYKQAISIIRGTGTNIALMIDASGCGQDPDGIIKYGQELVQHDPYKNLIFSVHMYAMWINYYNIGAKLWDIQQKGLTVIVGEFAMKLDCKNPATTLDAWEIMRQCKWKNIGYLGWSWHGNGKSEGCWTESDLNMVPGNAEVASTWKQNIYTQWGQALVYYTDFGIKDTSVRASVF